jgi:hypothetical protein
VQAIATGGNGATIRGVTQYNREQVNRTLTLGSNLNAPTVTLAVGWFITPDQSASVIANLSPLALAFVAGYGSDLLFAVLDRIVHAFSAPPPAEPAGESLLAAESPQAVRAERTTPVSPRGAAAARSRGRRAGANGAAPGQTPVLAH